MNPDDQSKVLRSVLRDGVFNGETTRDPRELKNPEPSKKPYQFVREFRDNYVQPSGIRPGKRVKDMSHERDILTEEYALKESVLVAFRIDPRDKVLLLQAAKDANLSLSEFIRKATITTALSGSIHKLFYQVRKRWSHEQEQLIIDFLSKYPKMSFSSKQIAKSTGIVRKLVTQIITDLKSRGITETGRFQKLDPEPGTRSLAFYKIAVNHSLIDSKKEGVRSGGFMALEGDQ